ncbi:MAG: mechanosensitive ion channel family protein [Bacteroidota bacterium]
MRILLCLFLVLSFWQLGQTQNYDDLPVTLKSPFNTVYTHLHYLQSDNYDPEKSARTIFGVEDKEEAKEVAIKLKQILDGRGLFVRLNRLPQNPNFREDSISNRQVYTLFPLELPEVYVERIDSLWYYSAETIDNVDKLHKQVYPFGTDRLLNLVPQFGHTKVLGIALWQYLGLLILLIGALLLHAILSRILNPIVQRLTRSKLYPSIINPKWISRIAQYTSIIIILRFIQLFLTALQLPVKTFQFAIIVIKILTVTLVIMVLLQVVEIVMAYAKSVTKKTDSKMDEQLMPIVKRVLQAVVISVGIVQILTTLDVDVTTLIAGISIGGLALALAAQDTLKNLFGSLMIFLDRPFQIGDWINFADIDGTVEEVGFRSTRVRTFANSLVYVPNGKLADMTINNFGLRIYRRFTTKIAIAYSTPTERIEAFVEGVRFILKEHPSTRKQGQEVHLNDMNASSLDILVYVFFDVADWSAELKGKHQILMSIIELAKKLDVQFAFPSTSIYVESMPEQSKDAPQKEELGAIQAQLAEFEKQLKAKWKLG